jgi:anti-sigma B factor antagonist
MSSNTPGTLTVDLVGPSTWTVALHGEHDLTTTDQIRAEFNAIFAQGTTMVVDLSDATFIESGVVGELLRAQQRVNRHPTEHLAVVAPPDGAPRRVLDLLDVGRIVDIFPSRDAAAALTRTTARPDTLPGYRSATRSGYGRVTERVPARDRRPAPADAVRAEHPPFANSRAVHGPRRPAAQHFARATADSRLF